MRRTLSVIALVALATAPLSAQEGGAGGGPGGRSAELPLKAARTVKFTTDEGTWLSIDVSPDGQKLAFDMAGDIYTLPIAGGTAAFVPPWSFVRTDPM